MKITCPNCQKEYSLDPAKLPSVVKTAKCKVCGQLIRLDSASPMPSIGQPAIIKITCCYCGRNYKILRHKIPPKITVVKCKACGHQITLQPSPAKAAAGNHRQPKAQPVGTLVAESNLMPTEETPSVHRSRKKRRLLALAAGLALVVISGASASRHMVHFNWLRQLFPGKTELKAESTQLLESEPFLALNLNVPLILDALENRLPPDKKTPRLQKIMTMMALMDLKKLKLYLYTDTATQNEVLPVILALTGSRQQFENAFNSQETFTKYLTPKSGTSYGLREAALADAAKYKFSLKPYEVALIDGGAVLAPASFCSTLKKNPAILTNSPIAGFIQSIATPHDLASFAVRISAGRNPGWADKIQNLSALQSNPQTALLAGMAAAVMSQLNGSPESTDFLGLAFRFSGSKERTLTYAQQFRPGVDGEEIYRQLAAANPADAKVKGIIRNLIELFQNHHYRHTVNFNDNRLDLGFSWSKEDDDAFLTALTSATIGQLFAANRQLLPTLGAVETLYAPEPNLAAAVDIDRLKVRIPHIISKSIFPNNYWNIGNNPIMTLDLDSVDIPNASLAELTYKVKKIQTPDGKDVLRVEEGKFKPRIHPGSLLSGNISLNIKKDTPPEALGKATINFHLSLPTALAIFDFKMGDKKESVKEVNGIRVTLNRLEKDVARVSCSSEKPMRLIAYDQSGNALASKESIGTSSSVSTRFQGIIDTLKVVVILNTLQYSFEVEVDLNGGKALALSREAEIPSRIRYDHHPMTAYVDFTAEDMKKLNVTWNEGQKDAWNDSLSIKLPRGPFSGHAIWEVHFFSHNKPQFLTGSSFQNSTDVGYNLDKGALKQVSAAFGKVQLNLHSDISRLTFFREEGTQPAVQKLGSGDEVSVAFNENEITYSAGTAEVIQTAAYDVRGKRLKQDQYTRNKADKRIIYFWGVPVKFEIDVAATTIKKLIPFDIRQRPVDEEAYMAYRQVIENQREVVKTLKTIDRARRSDRTYYGDDLAGLYYLYDQKMQTPMRLISEDVAHSDPAGQERFGYQATPYKGYYFTVLSGIEDNGVKKNYSRRLKKSSFTWQKGTIITTALTRHPDLVAIPQDSSQPTFFLQWGQVFMRPLNGERLAYLPEGYYNQGWVEAKFIEG